MKLRQIVIRNGERELSDAEDQQTHQIRLQMRFQSILIESRDKPTLKPHFAARLHSFPELLTQII
jgi:hypothetical protein